MTWLLLCGALVTAGLGERNPGYYCGLAVVEPRVRLEMQADTQDKYTRAGWRVGVVADGVIWHLRTVAVTAGVAYVHRDGGPWTKRRLGLRGGLDVAGLTVTYEHEVCQDVGYANRVRMVEIRTNHAERIDLRIASYHYAASFTGEPRWGARVQAGVRIGRLRHE